MEEKNYVFPISVLVSNRQRWKSVEKPYQQNKKRKLWERRKREILSILKYYWR